MAACMTFAAPSVGSHLWPRRRRAGLSVSAAPRERAESQARFRRMRLLLPSFWPDLPRARS